MAPCSSTLTIRAHPRAGWGNLQLPLPPDAAAPLPMKVQLFDKDWKDADDLLGTSKAVKLEVLPALAPRLIAPG